MYLKPECFREKKKERLVNKNTSRWYGIGVNLGFVVAILCTTRLYAERGGKQLTKSGDNGLKKIWPNHGNLTKKKGRGGGGKEKSRWRVQITKN